MKTTLQELHQFKMNESDIPSDILDANTSAKNESGDKLKSEPRKRECAKNMFGQGESIARKECKDILLDLDMDRLSIIDNKENIKFQPDTNQNDNKIENNVLDPKPKKEKRARRPVQNAESKGKKVRLSERVSRESRGQKDEEQVLTRLKLPGSKAVIEASKIEATTEHRKHLFTGKAVIEASKTEATTDHRKHLFTGKAVFKQEHGSEVDVAEGDQPKAKGKRHKSHTQIKDTMGDGQSTKLIGRVEEKHARRMRNNPIQQWLGIIHFNDEKAAAILDTNNDEKAAAILNTNNDEKAAKLNTNNDEKAAKTNTNNDEKAAILDTNNASRSLNYSSVVPMTLSCIADTELHPDAKDCGGVDYAAIYRYLACVCQGEAPPDLDPPTANKTLSLLPMLAGVIQKMDLEKEEWWLEQYTSIHSGSGYVREAHFDAERESVKNIERMSRIPGLNPLRIDAEACVDKNVVMPKEV